MNPKRPHKQRPYNEPFGLQQDGYLITRPHSLTVSLACCR